MKLKIIYLLILLLFIGVTEVYSQESTVIASCCSSEDGGRCTGSAYCTACKNCSGCKHCNSVGSCGVCSGGRTVRKKSTSSRKSSTYKTKSSKINSINGSTYSTKKTNTYSISDYLLVTASTLNMRSGPGTQYKIVEKLSYYDKLKYLDRKGNWLKVKVVESEKIGWVYYKYVE